MLEELRKSLHGTGVTDFGFDAILENATSVRDAFLDDSETDLIGAENDPEIKDLVEKLPEYGGDPEEIEEDVEALTEALAATATRPSEHTVDNIKGQIASIRADNQKLQRELEFYQKRANNYQMMRARAGIQSNNKKIADLESRLKSL